MEVMGRVTELQESTVIDAVLYELYKNGTVRIVDLDSAELVSLTRYTSFEAARDVYNKTVTILRRGK